MKKFLPIFLSLLAMPQLMAEEIPSQDITGEYYLYFYGIFDRKETTADKPLCKILIRDTDNGNVTVGPFGEYGPYFSAEYDRGAQTLTFPLGQESDCDGTPMTIYSYDVKSWKARPAVMQINREKHYISYAKPDTDGTSYNEYLIIGRSKANPGTMVYAQMYEGTLFAANSTMQYRQAADGSTHSAHIRIDPTDTGFRLLNFANMGLSRAVEFSADASTHTATACAPANMDDLYPLGTSQQPLALGAEYRDGVLHLLFNGAVSCQCGIVHDIDITMTFDPFTAGAYEIKAGDDTPAEYYDINGMQVEAPRRGIYIRRSNARTDKVFVR